jgi:CubicO group peptidase (beta-lactamase class C family)
MQMMPWITILLLLVVGLGPITWAGEGDIESVYPGRVWTKAQPGEVGMDKESLERARDYALTFGGSGYITRHGRLVMSWGSPDQLYDVKSTTKSIGVTALGLAIGDGKIYLTDRAVQHQSRLAVPPYSNLQTGWINNITIKHLATHTAGLEMPGGYNNLTFTPGTKWSYSDGGANWLAECITLAYGRDVEDVLFERVFSFLGITRQDLTWRQNSYRPTEIYGITRREFGSGITTNVDALARIGYLYLRRGRWKDQQIIPQDFVAAAGTTAESVVGLPEVDQRLFGNASDHYGLLWWNNADGTLRSIPTDAFWSWGVLESLILIIPSLDIVVARVGGRWQSGWTGNYNVLRPFFEPIVASVPRKKAPPKAAIWLLLTD